MNQIYLQLVEEINELTRIIEQIRNDIESYLKMGDVFHGPSGIHGVDYSADKVVTGKKISFGDAIQKIDAKENILKPYLERLTVLRSLKERFDELIDDDRDTLEESVYYMRFIKKYSQRQTASELGYSERHIQRIEKKIREKVM